MELPFNLSLINAAAYVSPAPQVSTTSTAVAWEIVRSPFSNTTLPNSPHVITTVFRPALIALAAKAFNSSDSGFKLKE